MYSYKSLRKDRNPNEKIGKGYGRKKQSLTCI